MQLPHRRRHWAETGSKRGRGLSPGTGQASCNSTASSRGYSPVRASSSSVPVTDPPPATAEGLTSRPKRLLPPLDFRVLLLLLLLAPFPLVVKQSLDRDQDWHLLLSTDQLTLVVVTDPDVSVVALLDLDA